ncbi:MAG: flippase-like domain-containing protein [Deltaproteobacteria bacterium]|nr:flippase-like domain-containing protein [Deltaproteobacteria bacterium]
MTRRRGALLLGLATSAVFLALAFRKIPVRQVLSAVADVDLRILSLVLVTKVLFFTLASVRTSILLGTRRRYTFRQLFTSQIIGFVANNALPVRTGELVRIDDLAREGGLPRSGILPVVVVERLFDAASLGVLFVFALPFVAGRLPHGTALGVSLASTVLAIAVLYLLRRWPDRFVTLCEAAGRPLGARVEAFVLEKARNVAEGLRAIPSGAAVPGVAALSAGIWACAMASVQIWLWAFGIRLPWQAPLLVRVFLAFGLAVPSTPGHVGTYHYFAVAGLSAAGLDPVRGLSVAIVGHAAAIVPFTLLGIPVFLREVLRRRGPAPGP